MIILCLVACLALAELVLRVVPTEFSSPGPRYIPDPRFGGMLQPNQEFDIVASCYSARKISVNSHGFRDEERSFEKSRPRVAIIGDSYVAALQVEDDQTFYALLGRRIRDMEFLAFGRDGFGTVQQLVLYESVVRRFSPDIVILMFFTHNDLTDNSEALKRAQGNTEARPFARLEEEGLEIYFSEGARRDAVPTGAIRALRNFLHWHSALYRLVKGVLKRRRAESRFGLADSVGRGGDDAESTHRIVGRHFNWNVYIPPSANHPDWEKSWEATEAVLERFSETVKRDGSRFVLAVIEERLHFDSDNAELGLVKRENPDFDPYYPARRLREFSERQGIEFLDFNGFMLDYAKRHRLGETPFWHACDGHWSAEGHRAVAEILGSYLRTQ